MKRRRKTSSRRRSQRQNSRDRYIRIVAISMVIIAAASFYIYQRVWVRQLVSEIEQLENRNIAAARFAATLEAKWKSASSIGAIEERIEQLKLELRPTLPSQNLVFRSPEKTGGRFAGFFNALDKLTRHLPVIQSSEADAQELFDTK